ncbi:uncharacterized protein crybg2 [Conger conger]|uniref:uncharacterized protein crybg2 n=1 Tax=Conger conger TaxID=82655 RepID=UPI002A5A6E5E|nr:uncharacterized protein crybg2 [Conger conger]
MAKKSLSTKNKLKSLFSKSEVNLEESAENDVSGSDGGKILKLFKWKKKKKTEPEADKTEEKTVSQTELDGSGTGLDKDGIDWPNGGNGKKLKMYGTAPRSKKGLLSYSETDLHKPRKFKTFSFAWKKKSKQRATTPSHNATGPDTPQGQEEDDLEESVDLTPDPGHATDRRVRFSDPEPPEPLVNLPPPYGPVDQSKPYKEIPDTPAVPAGTAPVHVGGEEGQEVQAKGPDEPAPLTGRGEEREEERGEEHEEEQSSAASAALAALSRAVSLRSGLPNTEPASPSRSPPTPPVAPDTDSPLPETDLPHDDASLLKNEISEMAGPISSLSEPVASNTDLSFPKIPLSDTPIPDSDLSFALAGETNNSLLSEVLGGISKTSLLSTDLSDAATLPNTDSFVPKTEVCDTVIPDVDTSLPNTDLSDTVAPKSSANPNTSLAYTNFSDALSHDIDSFFPKTEISNIDALDPSFYSTDPSDTTVTNTDSSHKIEVPASNLPGTDITLKYTDLPETAVYNTGTSSAKMEIYSSTIPKTSLPYTDFSDALSHDMDSFFPKTEISNIDAPDSSIPNTDHSSPVIIKTVLSPANDEIFFPKTDIYQPANTDPSTPNTDISSPVIIKTVLSPANNETFFPKTDIYQPANTNPSTPYTDISSPVIIKTVLSPANNETFFSKTDIYQPASTDPPSPNTDLFSPVIIKTVLSPANDETFFPKTDIYQPVSTDHPSPNTDISSPVIIKTVLAPANDETFFPKTDIYQPASTDPPSPNTDLSSPVIIKTVLSQANDETLFPQTDIYQFANTDPSTPNTDHFSPVIIKTVLSPANDETFFPKTDIYQPANTDPSTPNTDISSPVIIKTVLSQANDETLFPQTDIYQFANTDPSTPNTDHFSPVIIKTVLSPANDETFFPKTDIYQPANTDSSTPYTDHSSPVIIKTVLSPANDETFFPKADIYQPASTDPSTPNTDISSPVIIKTVLSPANNETLFPKTDIYQPASTDPPSPNTDLSSPVIIKTVLSQANDETLFPKTDIYQPASTDSPIPNTDLSDGLAPNTENIITSYADVHLRNTDLSAPNLPNINSSLQNTDLSNSVTSNTDEVSDVDISHPELSSHVIIDTVLSLAKDEASFPKTDIHQPANTDLPNSVTPNTDISPHYTDLSDAVEITNVVAQDIHNSDPRFPNIDSSTANTDLSDGLAPNTEVTNDVPSHTDFPLRNTDLSAMNFPNIDSSLQNTDLSNSVTSITDEVSDVITPHPDLPSPDEASFPKTDIYQPAHIGLSLPLHLKVDLPSPGLSVTENLHPFDPSADDLERSHPDTADQDSTVNLSVEIPDTISDRQEAGMQEDELDRGLAAAETGRQCEGGQEPRWDTEHIPRGPQENETGDVIVVAPPNQEEDLDGQGEVGVPYQECKDGGLIEETKEELEQWREDRQRQEETAEKAIEKVAAGRLNLEEVEVEGQDGEKVAEALKEEGKRGLQVEYLEVLGQKEQVKEEMEVEVEQRPQLPAMKPDSPVQQDCVPQECDPAPPSPTTEGAELPLNRIVATEKHPCVLFSEEKTAEKEDRWTANIHNTQRESILTDTVSETTHTLTDTVTEAAHTLTDTVTEAAPTLTDTVTESEHTLTDTVTEEIDSTHTSTLGDTSTGTEDLLPSFSSPAPAVQASRFLDDLSGPWGPAEESVSPEVEEDPDTMNSGYGVLSTTLTVKPAVPRDVKDDGRQRFHKVSLVSGYDEPGRDRSSSPVAGRYELERSPTGSETLRVFLSREEKSEPQPGSESLGPLKSGYSPAFLDTPRLPSADTNHGAGFAAPSPEEPGSYGNGGSSSERSEVHSSWEPEPGRWDRAELAAPAEERGREGEINSGSDSHWLTDGGFSPTQADVPFSGVFTATRVNLLPSPTSPDLGSPYDMDTLVDTLKSMDPPQRPRLSRPPPLSTMASLPPIVEDSPVQAPKVQNGTSSPLSLPMDLGLKWNLSKDPVSPLEMMKRQAEVDGGDQRSRPLPLRASADSSIVFRKIPPASPSPEGPATSPQLNGGPSPSPSRLDGSLLFSSYRLENGKPQSTRPLTRTASLPDSGPKERLSSGPSMSAADPQTTSRYERLSFLMSPSASLPDAPEPARISRPPALSLGPLGELGFSLGPSSPMDLLHSPSMESHSILQRSLSVESPLAKMGSYIPPQQEPERPAVIKYRAFPDAYRTKEKEHGKLNPRPGKLLIYTQPGLKGERIEIRGDVLDATTWDLPETIYIRVIRGGWVLYEKPNFKGEKVALDEEDVELPYPFRSPEEEQEVEGEKNGQKEGEEEVKSQPSRKFVIGSLRRAVRDYSVPEISLFPEENAEGKKVIFRDTSEDARIFGYPVKANSIIIKAGLWLVYAHPFMQGVPRVLEVGGYTNPAAWGVTKPYVGSVHPLKIGEPRVEKPNEPKLVVFDKPYFSGKSRDVYTHLRDFLTRTDMKQTAFMSSAGSIKVVGGCWVGYSKEGFRGHQYLLEEGEYQDWRVWGGCDSELRSVRLIRADFTEPVLVMIAQPEEEEQEEEKMTFEVTEAIPDVEPFNYPTSTQSIHVLSGAWIAYSHVDFSGNQYILEKGFYNNPGDWGASDNKICSIQPILLAPTETPTNRNQVLLYSEPDFQGQCQLCQENKDSLPEEFLIKSCRVLRGSWVVYEGREYSGNLYILPEGDYPNLNSMGCPPSCSLRSLKIVPLIFAVPSISLFGLECFEGREVTLETEMGNLVDEGFNNHVLSVRVNSGCWVVCEHSNYRGRQILLEPIEVPNWLKFSGIPTIGSMHPIRQKRHFFRIKNQERGHFMSIQGGVEEMKSGRVVVTEEVESMSDIWFYQDGLIKNKLAPSMCLQVMGEVEEGAKVVLWSETRQPIQLWTAQTSGIIRSLTFQGIALDLKGGKTYDRNHVIIHRESEERPTQQWEIELL